MKLIDEIYEHGTAAAPEEACGLVVGWGHHSRLIRARNLALNPRLDFDLDPAAWLEVKDHEKVLAVYHTHPNGRAQPSLADRASCELSGVPWYIVALPSKEWVRIEPEGFRAPYLERPYVYGVHDCYGLVRDWFQWEHDIQLPLIHKPYGWWDRRENHFWENFPAAGFEQLRPEEPIRRGDLFLIQMQATVPNHVALYLGEEQILHHPDGRLSTIDPWGGYWSRHHFATLRHSRMKGSSG